MIRRDFEVFSSTKKEPIAVSQKKKGSGSQPILIVSNRCATPVEAARIDRALDGLLAEYVRQVLTQWR